VFTRQYAYLRAAASMKQLIWLGCSAGLAYYLYRRTHRLIVRVSHRPVYEASATGLVIDDVGTIVSVNQYKMQTWLGRGSFGEVYRATDEHGESVAIKRIDRSKSKPKKLGRPPARPVPGGGTGDVNAVTREIAVMKKIDHPNCVKLFEVIFDTRGGRIFLAMELLQGGEVSTVALALALALAVPSGCPLSLGLRGASEITRCASLAGDARVELGRKGISHRTSCSPSRTRPAQWSLPPPQPRHHPPRHQTGEPGVC
jgi:hypothetical protein